MSSLSPLCQFEGIRGTQLFCYKTTSLIKTNIFHIVVGLCRPLHLFMFTNSKINWIKDYYSDKVIPYLISTRKKNSCAVQNKSMSYHISG